VEGQIYSAVGPRYGSGIFGLRGRYTVQWAPDMIVEYVRGFCWDGGTDLQCSGPPI
jgi:hypothetical protein